MLFLVVTGAEEQPVIPAPQGARDKAQIHPASLSRLFCSVNYFVPQMSAVTFPRNRARIEIIIPQPRNGKPGSARICTCGHRRAVLCAAPGADLKPEGTWPHLGLRQLAAALHQKDIP